MKNYSGSFCFIFEKNWHRCYNTRSSIKWQYMWNFIDPD